MLQETLFRFYRSYETLIRCQWNVPILSYACGGMTIYKHITALVRYIYTYSVEQYNVYSVS